MLSRNIILSTLIIALFISCSKKEDKQPNNISDHRDLNGNDNTTVVDSVSSKDGKLKLTYSKFSEDEINEQLAASEVELTKPLFSYKTFNANVFKLTINSEDRPTAYIEPKVILNTLDSNFHLTQMLKFNISMMNSNNTQLPLNQRVQNFEELKTQLKRNYKINNIETLPTCLKDAYITIGEARLSLNFNKEKSCQINTDFSLKTQVQQDLKEAFFSNIASDKNIKLRLDFQISKEVNLGNYVLNVDSNWILDHLADNLDTLDEEISKAQMNEYINILTKKMAIELEREDIIKTKSSAISLYIANEFFSNTTDCDSSEFCYKLNLNGASLLMAWNKKESVSISDKVTRSFKFIVDKTNLKKVAIPHIKNSNAIKVSHLNGPLLIHFKSADLKSIAEAEENRKVSKLVCVEWERICFQDICLPWVGDCIKEEDQYTLIKKKYMKAGSLITYNFLEDRMHNILRNFTLHNTWKDEDDIPFYNEAVLTDLEFFTADNKQNLIVLPNVDFSTFKASELFFNQHASFQYRYYSETIVTPWRSTPQTSFEEGFRYNRVQTLRVEILELFKHLKLEFVPKKNI